MPLELDDLAVYVGADLLNDVERLQDAAVVAEEMVAAAFEGNWRPVPEFVYDECVKRTAKALYQSQQTSENGFLTTPDGTAIPGVANDPLQKSWVIIKRYTNRL